MWAYEVYEMYRRLFLVGVLPLLGEKTVRAFIGIFVCIWTAHIARELWPFNRSTTCVLLVVGTIQILIVFFSAALILTGSLKGFGLSDFELGAILLGVNLLSFAMVFYWGYGIRWEEKRREKEQRKEEHAVFLQTQAEGSAAVQLIEAAKNKLNKSGGRTGLNHWIFRLNFSIKSGNCTEFSKHFANFLEFSMNLDIFEHVPEIPTKFHLHFDEK